MKFADMEANDITVAPQMADVSYFFERWRKTNVGSKDQFYRFLTVPSREREEFYRSFYVATTFLGASLTATMRLPDAGLGLDPIKPDLPDTPLIPTIK